MNIRLVRHATLIIELDDGRTLLIDPMLGNIGEFRSFLTELTVPPNNTNPTVSLPSSPDFSSILSSKDTAVFVTHTHPDHFDQAAVNELPKDLHFFCQLLDKETLSNIYGFSSVQPVDANLPPYDGIEVFRTDGQHGPHNLDSQGNYNGPVSGFVLRSENEPTLYIAGDTIFCQEVNDAPLYDAVSDITLERRKNSASI